jgi:hypothetical protein
MSYSDRNDYSEAAIFIDSRKKFRQAFPTVRSFGVVAFFDILLEIEVHKLLSHASKNPRF